jgi:hypothetical protein
MDHVPLELALDQLSDHLRARAARCASTGQPADPSAAALLRLADVAATTTSRAAEEDLSLHLSRERLLDAAALLQEHAAA